MLRSIRPFAGGAPARAAVLVGLATVTGVTAAQAPTPPRATPGTTASTSAPAPRPDPLDARAPVPPVVHRSSLASFRLPAETPVGSWREANDTVARIGGWRTYAREATASPPPAAPAPTPTPAASAPGGGAR